MKIGVIGDSLMFKGTGSGTYLYFLFKHLLNNESEENKIFLILNENKKNMDVPFSNCKVLYVSNFPIIKEFQLRSFDWLILNGISVFSPIYLPMKRLVIIHGGYELIDSKLKGHYKKKYWRNLLLTRSKINMTVSKSSKLLLEDNIFNNKFYVNHCGVDHDDFKQIKLNSFICNEVTLVENEYLFHLSRYVPRKNPDELFEVFKILKKQPKTSRIKLVLGGKGWGEKVMLFKKNNPELSQDFIYLGFINKDDLKKFYSNALAFLFFSKYEGFGMPVMEAMSCKCISIINNKFSLPEVGLKETVFSIETQKNDIVNLIEKIYENSDYREDLKNKSYEKSLKFDWRFTAKKTLNLLRNV
jgi:glycosyltransferase involved in cell wall biosynthesis